MIVQVAHIDEIDSTVSINTHLVGQTIDLTYRHGVLGSSSGYRLFVVTADAGQETCGSSNSFVSSESIEPAMLTEYGLGDRKSPFFDDV